MYPAAPSAAPPHDVARLIAAPVSLLPGCADELVGTGRLALVARSDAVKIGRSLPAPSSRPQKHERDRAQESTHRRSPRLCNSAHLELSVLDREGEAAFDQIERVLAELLIAPAGEDIEVLAHAGCEGFEVVGTGDQPGRDARFLRADLEQELEQVADQRAHPW